MESRPEDEKNEALKFQAEVNELQWSLIKMFLKNLIDISEVSRLGVPIGADSPYVQTYRKLCLEKEGKSDDNGRIHMHVPFSRFQCSPKYFSDETSSKLPRSGDL